MPEHLPGTPVDVGPFALLDHDLPLLLLPVRLETRFDLESRPRRLLVRIHPDHVHADTLVRGLDPEEVKLGEGFWSRAWSGAGGRVARDQDFARLASRLGPHRAAWVLESTRPRNWGDRPGTAKPDFPTPPERAAVSPGRARLLPDRFVVSGWQYNEHQFTVTGAAIEGDPAITPDLAGTGTAPRELRELLETQGMAWLRDFDAAAAAGMAVRVDLPGSLQLGGGIDLFVVGASAGLGSDGAPAALADLLAAHHFTHGLDFVRRGTPTNNTDQGTSPVSLSSPDLSALLDTALAVPGARPVTTRPLSRRRAAGAAKLALGMGDGTLLERVPLAEDAQLDLAAAMNAALWPATWGHLLRGMASGALSDDDIAWTRDHFIENVRGGGVLPALRLGRQPYGLLAAHPDPPGSGTEPVDRLERLLLGLLPAWDEAVRTRVAHLDPDATDLTGEGGAGQATLGEATARLARILGATPNPSELVLQPVTSEMSRIIGAWFLLVVFLDFGLAEFPELASDVGRDLAAAATLEEVIEVFESLIEGGGFDSDTAHVGPLWAEAFTGDDPEMRAAAQAALVHVENEILPLLYEHRTRAQPLLDLGPDRDEVTGLPNDDGDPPLFFCTFDEAGRVAFTGGLVGEDPGAWLAALVAEAENPAQAADAPADHAPLLFQLLKRSLAVVDADDRPAMLEGLRTLAAASGDGRLPDPSADLETLMGETLGTAMHRIDAWLSGRAARRLANVREKHPAGLNIGAFGWVVSLRPADARASQGFVHAPSLDHAATAAILRSGWSGLGEALAVNVSSSRARSAAWLIDGIRDGQGLAELLGQGVERRLHDARLDHHVEPLRRLVLDATGRPGVPANAIVDGLLVARAWLGEDDIAPLTADEEAVRDKLLAHVTAANDEKRLSDVLDAHLAELDAVADASLLQSVHALVRGNPEQASAALGGVGSADAAPGPLTALRTPRGGQRLSHRVLLAVDPAAEGGTSPAALAEPALDAWVASLLSAVPVVYDAWVTENGERRRTGPHALAGAGLGGLELLDSMPGGEELAGSAIERRLAWKIEREAAGEGRSVAATIEPASQGTGGELPLRLFLPAAQALRALLRTGRAADAPDLAADVAGSTADSAAIAVREAGLAEAAAAAATRVRQALAAGAPDLVDAIAALAAWGVPGTPPSAGLSDLATGGGDAADRAALEAAAEAALVTLDARATARAAIEGDDLARIRALLPGALVAPPFSPADPEALARAAARSRERLGGPAGAFPWLRQVGRVRERVRAAADAVDLVEAAAARPLFAPVLVQLPDHPQEGWAATTAPQADTRPRTCLLALSAPARLDRVSGLVIDAWTEVVPDRETTTGIALHFDSPSARPPQAFLLAVPPTDGAWAQAGVLELVRQTLERARYRAVGPEELEGYGQYLPALFLDDETDPGPTVVASAAP